LQGVVIVIALSFTGIGVPIEGGALPNQT
jgi:hypothetical protein